ncbi:MAG TPA: DUF917 domain-containing protein [Pseudonocardia sp.]|nr:DUF917 domain-containing protein [Pseudonocardia sp.]
MICAAEPPVVRADDVDQLVVGVGLLGSGGGGDAAAFGRVLRNRLGDGELSLHAPGDLPGAVVVPSGIVGATSVFTEKLPGGHEFVGACAAVARWTGREPTAVIGLEAGGINGITALVAALDLALPFVDADLMGRALPRLDQLTWAARGLAVTPCALCEPNGQIVLIADADPAALERTARSFLPVAGGWAAIALPPTDVGPGTREAVTGSAARALALGRAHATLPSTPPPDLVEDVLGARVLATGRVLEVARHGGNGGFGRGSVTVVDGEAGTVVRLETENEFLLAIADGVPVAACPDLLCLLDRRTAAPLGVDRLRTGDEVLVVVLPGPSWWRHPDVLPRVAPEAFGLCCPPVLFGDA